MSEYFRNKIGWTDADRIWLLTPEDRKRNKETLDSGIPGSSTKGSVVIMSGHSNSDSLLGKGYFALLFDEVASFKTTGGGSSGDRLYGALGPGTVAFGRPIFDENGDPVYNEHGQIKKRLDSKIISISSPRAEEGVFYRLYKTASETEDRLAFRLPTWKVNLGIPEDMLRTQNKYMSTNQFQMEFGAEFSGTAGEKFIADRYIDEAMELGSELHLDQRIEGRPGILYFAHLDPAATSHNYALVVLHTERRFQIKIKENGMKVKENVRVFVVDHIKCWHPEPGSAINVHDVDEYIINLAKRFRFAMVSYDNWNSLSSMQKLRSRGIPTKVTAFRKQYKMLIYDQLEHLLVNHQLALPPKGPYHEQMGMELKCLKRIYTPVGFKIQPDPEAQITTDDFCDAIAGVCGIATENTYSGYARGTTVNMPQSRDQTQWSIGRGTYKAANWRFLHKKFGKFG